MLPAKALPDAKSRLSPATVDQATHRRLVQAIRADTAAAAQSADGVARILYVTDQPGTDGALVQRESGLNAALTEAAEHAAQRWPADGIAALLADLPALRPAELAIALAQAAAYPRSYVADADGTGTTLLTALPGVALQPAFGPGSAARHAAAAVALPGGPSLRRDVDTVADLRAALELGVGPATAGLLGLGVTVRSP